MANRSEARHIKTDDDGNQVRIFIDENLTQMRARVCKNLREEKTPHRVSDGKIHITTAGENPVTVKILDSPSDWEGLDWPDAVKIELGVYPKDWNRQFGSNKHNRRNGSSPAPDPQIDVSLVSLNVGGISSKFRYNILPEYIKKYHIILFGETKLSKIPQDKFPDYNIFSFKQKTRLHGLSVLLKNNFFSYTKKLYGKSKCVLWLLLGSSEVKLHFILGAVYVPGYDSKFSDENDFDIISEDVLSFREKFNLPFILMGDFNARTGNLTDRQNTDSDTDSSPPIPRVSKDQKIDT